MNDCMDSLKPLDSDQKKLFGHPAHRLISARETLHRSYHDHPVQRDMFAETEAVAAWSIVTLSYSGIEQTMKCLLKMQGVFSAKPLRNGGHRHHNIGKLFKELTPDEQRVLRVYYAVYHSLHDYVHPQTIDCFLDAIDDGYQQWRYFLLDGQQPPTTHCGAMLEIWYALTDILMAKVFTNHGLNTVKHRIDSRLRRWIVRDAWFEHINTGIGKPEIDDLNRWILDYNSNCINACADLFHRHANDTTHLIDVLPSTLRVLLSVVAIADRHKTDQDFVYFLHRAKIVGLTWNSLKNRFENILQPST